MRNIHKIYRKKEGMNVIRLYDRYMEVGIRARVYAIL